MFVWAARLQFIYLWMGKQLLYQYFVLLNNSTASIFLFLTQKYFLVNKNDSYKPSKSLEALMEVIKIRNSNALVGSISNRCFGKWARASPLMLLRIFSIGRLKIIVNTCILRILKAMLLINTEVMKPPLSSSLHLTVVALFVVVVVKKERSIYLLKLPIITHCSFLWFNGLRWRR